MGKIEIKSLFSGWMEVDRKTAKKYVEFLMRHISRSDKKVKTEYINKNRLRGVTVEELLKQ